MCVITTTALAAGGTALTLGIGSLSVTTGALATTAIGTGLLTAGAVAGSAALGAAASVGIAAATGARGKDLGRAALIGGATGGLLSGIGSLGALGSAFTQTGKTAADVAKTTTDVAKTTTEVAKTTTEVASKGLTPAETLAQGTSGAWEIGTTVGPEIQATAEVTEKGLTTAEKIAIGTGIGAAALQGVMAYNEGKATEEAADEAAKVQRQQAAAERLRAGQEMDAAHQEAIDAARKAKQQLGTGRAQMAANGVMMDDVREGSVPTTYEADTRAELAYDQAKIMHNAQLRAWGYRENARVLDLQAADTLRAAKSKARAGYISAALSGLTAGLNAYGSTKTLLS